MMQENWMITNYIDIPADVSQIIVNITFKECDACYTNISILMLELSEENEMQRANTIAYSHITCISSTDNGVTGTTIILSSGFYLALLDKGSCTSIERIVLYYYVCSQQKKDLVTYPETPAQGSLVVVNGACSHGAARYEQQNISMQLHCAHNGWLENELYCLCKPGYEVSCNSCKGMFTTRNVFVLPTMPFSSCTSLKYLYYVCMFLYKLNVGCAAGRYKPSLGNYNCYKCPINSDSTQVAATYCTCNRGFYRAGSDNIATPCTGIVHNHDDKN